MQPRSRTVRLLRPDDPVFSKTVCPLRPDSLAAARECCGTNPVLRTIRPLRPDNLLKEYCDSFSWNYTEMLGLSQEIVDHRLRIKSGFRPFKQRPRSFHLDLLPRIKDEIHWLLEDNFIRPCRYTEWVSNILSMEKKESGKLRVCIDFRNLNRATPKDKYPMPITDMLINNASGNRIVSFLDGNVGYNQIFMAEEDTSKMAFICSGFIGLFEWVVMKFGLKILVLLIRNL
jgi:hypothetical protein